MESMRNGSDIRVLVTPDGISAGLQLIHARFPTREAAGKTVRALNMVLMCVPVARPVLYQRQMDYVLAVVAPVEALSKGQLALLESVLPDDKKCFLRPDEVFDIVEGYYQTMGS